MIVRAELIGRFGNQLFQYAFARAWAEQNQHQLSTPAWVGETIFDIPETVREGWTEKVPEGYHQDQKSLIYTRSQCKSWFRFKPEIEQKLSDLKRLECAAHIRIGDYPDLGYVVVSVKSYQDACNKFHLPFPTIVTEEKPVLIDGLPNFLPDFYRIMKAKVILRGNSSFSWWAATLSDADVHSPIVRGLKGGQVQECEFVPGNHPRMTNLAGFTDLHLNP